MGQLTIILWAGPALRDLEEQLEFIGAEAPDAADRIAARIHRRVGRLARFPELGRMVPELQDPGLRELIEAPFRVIYERKVDQIRVLAVLRAEQDPDFEHIQER